MLADQIVKHLSGTVFPLSLNELAKAMPEAEPLEIEQTCNLLCQQHQLGRNGADTPSSPYRFYME